MTLAERTTERESHAFAVCEGTVTLALTDACSGRCRVLRGEGAWRPLAQRSSGVGRGVTSCSHRAARATSALSLLHDGDVVPWGRGPQTCASLGKEPGLPPRRGLTAPAEAPALCVI